MEICVEDILRTAVPRILVFFAWWGENWEILEKKNTWSPTSRTWLVSRDPSLARTHSGEMTNDLEP